MSQQRGAALWRVEADADEAVAYPILARDRIWNGYAIADLAPPLRQYTQVALATLPGTDRVASCLVLRHPDFTASVTYGDPDGLLAIFTTITLPQCTTFHLWPTHVALVRRYYEFVDELRVMLRMATTPSLFQPPAGEWRRTVRRLGPSDLSALEDLYTGYQESFFSADQLSSGVFYGVFQRSRLLSAGGTHALSLHHRITAVGNVFTRPEARGRGYATLVTAAVTADLFDRGIVDVILNVVEGNEAARALYERLGFTVHCRYWEGLGMRRWPNTAKPTAGE